MAQRHYYKYGKLLLMGGDYMTKYINTQLIENYIKENNLSMTAFCKKSNIGLKTFYKIMLNKNVMSKSLYKVSKFLGIKFNELFCA